MNSSGWFSKVLSLVLIALLSLEVCGADPKIIPLTSAVPYFEPELLTGSIYDKSDSSKLLFRFRRTATRSGNKVHVLREFTLPDGPVAARERVEYDGPNVVSFTLEELQTGAKGHALIRTAPGSIHTPEVVFRYTKGAFKKENVESFAPNLLISDMVAPFITEHWNILTNGAAVKLRLIALSRAETVGFKLVKDSQTLWKGKPVVQIRMEPSSILIAQFVAPLIFTIEKAPPHRILQYLGRTTPSISKNGKWEELDALTVFDWAEDSAVKPAE